MSINTDEIIWVVVIGVIVLIAAMVYDMCFRCRHEWEERTYSAIDYTTFNKVQVVYLVCKKCGKVKVFK